MLAKATAGSVENFVKMMNEKAQELKMNNSVFSNPSGLDEEDDGNVSTVKDMALLYDYCSSNPIFNEIVQTQVYKRLDGKGTWHNKNRLLKEYKYCVGGKTGFTKKAKRTLVTRAVKDHKDLIIVTFNCGNDFSFHQDKYEECFAKANELVLFDKGVENIEGQLFFFEQAFLVEVYHDEKVSYRVDQDVLSVYIDHHCIKKEKLKKYHFLDVCFMVLKDLCYV
ncbi:MAG: D-alanyl-D-alanine carboxypeptidase family protein [Faecalibacillus sp.]